MKTRTAAVALFGSLAFVLHMEGSTFPNFNGVDQKRLVKAISADELDFTSPTSPRGDHEFRLGTTCRGRRTGRGRSISRPSGTSPAEALGAFGMETGTAVSAAARLPRKRVTQDVTEGA
jgi:hypothetical protein